MDKVLQWDLRYDSGDVPDDACVRYVPTMPGDPVANSRRAATNGYSCFLLAVEVPRQDLDG